MRALILFAALALAAPCLLAPSLAYADGIERPHRRHPRPRPAPRIERVAPPAVQLAPIEGGPEVVTLSDSFFAGMSGGVGADVEAGSYSSSTVIIRGGGAHASAFAFASARASAHARGGAHGGGHGGCGCH